MLGFLDVYGFVGEGKGVWGRFKKPVVVSLVGLSVIACAIVLYFQSTGVLSSSREYPSLFAEAQTLGIPTTQQEIEEKAKQSSKGPNVYLTVKESLSTIEKSLGSTNLYPQKAQRADDRYLWQEKIRLFYNKCQASIQELGAIPHESYFLPLGKDATAFGPSVIHDRNVNTFRAFATSLANSGRFGEAKDNFVIAARLTSWQGNEHTVLKAMSLRNQLTLVDEISSFIKANPASPDLKKAMKLVCDVALETPYDFRQDYWRNLNTIVFPLSTKGMGWTNPSTPYGRALLWLNVPIVLQATKSDILRAHLAGYRMIQKDPQSIDVANKAHSTVLTELSKSNRLTQDLINDCTPINMASRIEQITKSLRDTQKRYQ